MRRELRDRTIKDPRAKRCSWRSTADGRSFELPYNAERRQSFEQIIGRVDLPPSKALSDAALASAVIVVPTLTHRDSTRFGQSELTSFTPRAARSTTVGYVHLDSTNWLECEKTTLPW